jgi:putative selenate reductase
MHPIPFGVLVRRAFLEHERQQSVFGLSRRQWFTGEPGTDLSVTVHGRRIGTPFGPAAGPHTQLAQNIVLSWLAGGRAIELKTVQARDSLVIPRPCIDMRTTGFNVEWSQELSHEEAFDEYVKAWMLVRMLAESGVVPAAARPADTVFDLSLGYDLAGIQGEAVTGFVRGMLDARPAIDRIRREIPDGFLRYGDVDFPTRVIDSVTLSTFHGCPPEEIEAIVGYLQRTFGLHCTVKLNPTLLGAMRVREILHDELGYVEVAVPDEVFEHDLRWDRAVELVERCGESAGALGLEFGAKCTNTLVVENRGDFLPSSERYSYLSGRPLHAMAIELVERLRERFGDRYPISFSAGIEQANFADAVALGLKPVTACTDLLRERGYARGSAYLRRLVERMSGVGASNVEEFIAWQAPANVRQRALSSSRARVRPPRKTGRRLALFDCLACDKCLPVCPNTARFSFVLPGAGFPLSEGAGARASFSAGGGAAQAARAAVEGGSTPAARHQIAVFLDLCNECGNCDVFCPEHGGPYRTKPRFFGTREAWAEADDDGLWAAGSTDEMTVCGRIGGAEYTLSRTVSATRFIGRDFDVTFDERAGSPLPCPVSGRVPDQTAYHLMAALGAAVLDRRSVNWVNVR